MFAAKVNIFWDDESVEPADCGGVKVHTDVAANAQARGIR